MSPNDRKALRLGTIVIVAALLTLRLIPSSVRWLSAEREKLKQERALLEETKALVKSAPQVGDSMVALTHKIADLAPSLLHGETNAEAEADLATRLTLSAERSRLSVGKMMPIPDSTVRADGTLHRVTVQATLTGDLNEVLGLMDTLAGSAPTLVPAAIRLVASEPGAPVVAPEALGVELTVTGWYLAKAKTP